MNHYFLKADRFGVRRPLDLIADVKAALDNWLRFASDAGLGAKTVEAVAWEFESV